MGGEEEEEEGPLSVGPPTEDDMEAEDRGVTLRWSGSPPTPKAEDEAGEASVTGEVEEREVV